MLTSLRVIRISDSFLPPLANQNSVPNAQANNTTAINFPVVENNSRINLMSSSSAANEE
jgi:hypothetical protein